MASAGFTVWTDIAQDFILDDVELTLIVGGVIDESARDPFDIIAELEDMLGFPIALS